MRFLNFMRRAFSKTGAFTLALVAGLTVAAVAGEVVDQGQPGQLPWLVTVSGGGTGGGGGGPATGVDGGVLYVAPINPLDGGAAYVIASVTVTPGLTPVTGVDGGLIYVAAINPADGGPLQLAGTLLLIGLDGGAPYLQLTGADGGAAFVQTNLPDGGGEYVQIVNPLSVTVGDGGVLATEVLDIYPLTQNITTADVASTTTAGQNGQSIITGTPTAGSTALYAIDGIGTVRVRISGTWSGTIAVEASPDSAAFASSSVHIFGSAIAVGSFTSNGLGYVLVSGAQALRFRATAWTSGTATVEVSETQNGGDTYIINPLRFLDGQGTSTLDTIEPAGTIPNTSNATAIVVSERDPITLGGGPDGGYAYVALAPSTVTALVTWIDGGVPYVNNFPQSADGGQAVYAQGLAEAQGMPPWPVDPQGSDAGIAYVADWIQAFPDGGYPQVGPAPDVMPATVNITAQDVASTTTVSAYGQPLITGTPTANSFASFTFNTETSLKIQVSGSWTGTLAVEGSMDNGTTWFPCNIVQPGQGLTITNNFTANFVGITTVAGRSQTRVRATTAWTGTATVRVTESTNTAALYSIQTPTRNTYSASTATLVAVTSATDVVEICGSSTRTIRVAFAEVGGTTATAAAQKVSLIVRSAADTGGTSTTLTDVPSDSTAPAGTATVLAYTANPALGATVGTIRSKACWFNVTAADGQPSQCQWDFGIRPGAGEVVLRGAAQCLAVNFNTSAAATTSTQISLEWTEE